MITAHEQNTSSRQNRGPWGFLFFFTILAGGAISLHSYRDAAWMPQFASLQKDAAESPGVDKPVPPKTAESATEPPSFDVAYADDSGKLAAAGRGEAGWVVRLKSGNTILGETKADQNGEWVLAPDKPLPSGEHSLSLQEVDPNGSHSILGKREIALTVAPRAAKASEVASNSGAKSIARQGNGSQDVKTASAQTDPSKSGATQKGCDVAVVERGDSLWRLAHRCYGEGTRYAKIYDSNRQQIHNPNLIYPKQQFVVPH